MARVTIIFALLLIGAGVATISAAEKKSPTALIPAFEGILLLGLGAAAAAKPGARKHIMHGAATVGLLGVILPLSRLPKAIFPAEGSDPKALVAASLAAMAALSAGFVVACVDSFIRARAEAKEAAGGAEPEAA
ncbi:MAG: hypothetical protein AAGJ97_10215 [Planctomycetota bacterium]